MTQKRTEAELKYRALCEEGAELALVLSNALILADRLDLSPLHWGVFEHDRALQARARAKAWVRVQALRSELRDLVEVDMANAAAAAAAGDDAVLERDVELKRDIAQLLMMKSSPDGAKGRSRTLLTQEETLALLAMWSSKPSSTNPS